MEIETSMTTHGDWLSDWLENRTLDVDTRNRFREFHRKVLRLRLAAEVTVLRRGIADVARGIHDNYVILKGLTDTQTLKLCHNRGYLTFDEPIENVELAQLELLRQMQKKSAALN